jgi:hypothetical protein
MEEGGSTESRLNYRIIRNQDAYQEYQMLLVYKCNRMAVTAKIGI